MNIQLLTKDDLQEFKEDLLEALHQMLASHLPSSGIAPQWLRSYEVRELLRVSTGTLQTMRMNGTLPGKKIGGLLYYSVKDIEQLMKK